MVTDNEVREFLLLAITQALSDHSLDNHKHECSNCQFVWDHVQSELATSEQYSAAHKCPVCGTEQRTKYLGPQTSSCFFDGKQLKWR